MAWRPYAIVDGANNPNLFAAKPDASRLPGVYAWAIPIRDEYWVYYIGKAEDHKALSARLQTEFRPKEAKRGYIVDTELLLKGERVPLYRPRNSKGEPDEASWQNNPEYFTVCSNHFREIVRIFIAPMLDARKLIRFAEGALISTIWDYEWDNWGDRPDDAYYFISCDENGPRRPTKPYRITMSLPAKIRGFEQTSEYTEPRATY
jgi:hypothetical protein